MATLYLFITVLFTLTKIEIQYVILDISFSRYVKTQPFSK